MADLTAKYRDLIQSMGPRVFLHPDELFEMSSIDWFLERTRLYYEENGSTNIHQGVITKENLLSVEEMLMEQGVTKTWLSILANDGQITNDLQISPISKGD